MIDRMRKADLLDGLKPQNVEEKTWIEDWRKSSEESRKASDNFEKRYNLYEEEKKQLLNKYAAKEYQEGGVFTTIDFERLEEKVENMVIEKIIEMHFDTHLDQVQESYRLKQEILKNEYGLDWYELEDSLPGEYFEQLKALRKKYDVWR